VSPIILSIFHSLLPNGIIVDILGSVSKFHKILQPLDTISKAVLYQKNLPYIRNNRGNSIIICKSIFNTYSCSRSNSFYSKPIIYNINYRYPKVNILSNIAGKLVNNGIFKQNTINKIIVKDSNILSYIYNKDIFINVRGNSKEYINFVQLSPYKIHYSNILYTYGKYNIIDIQHNNKNYYFVIKHGMTISNNIDIINSIKNNNIVGVGEVIKGGISIGEGVLASNISKGFNVYNDLSTEKNIGYSCCNYSEFNIPSKKKI
jgi:hypothetical protein